MRWGRERGYTLRDSESALTGRERRTSSVASPRLRAASAALPPVTGFDVGGDFFDPTDESVRPRGWADERMRRVMAREADARVTGETKEQAILLRKRRVELEEDAMVNEVARYGNVVGMGPVTVLGFSTGILAPPDLENDRKSQFHEDEVMTRVIRREQQEREAGAAEEQIAQTRENKRLEVCLR